ncbi:glucosidase 2 subunit alpha [Arctopsyche grandis]|uniref:glucosidase 2 subunit alpha n=1 Tax=Arctopsyche grandis TaxID=121162 RepID=UPI00406D7858
MGSWKLYFVAVFGFLISHTVVGVDKNNFKTCDQSSFCRRLRKLNPGNSPYELLLDTVSLDKHTLSADIRNNNYNVLFKLNLIALVDGTFRVVIDEKQPLKPRYKVEYVLNGEPTVDKLTVVEKNQNAGTIKVANGQGHSVILHSKPLKFDFFNPQNELVLSLNEKGLTTLEHLRHKPDHPKTDEEKKEDGENNDDNVPELQYQEENDPGAWEENYKSHHDTKPRGPEGLSMDVTFPKATHVYGIPEHADSFALKSTKGQDPYRLYNLDVFEYELDSTMAIYGAVPVAYAHGADGNTVGVFWLNAAETWVDVEAGRSGRADVVSSLVNLVSGSTAPLPSVRFMSESGVLDTFIFMGPSPSDCFRQYTKLTGTANLPQMFALAYHQCRWNYNDEEDVRSVEENFDRNDIPLDVIWLDIEYTDRKKYFTWDAIRFAHPNEMVTNLTSKGRKMVIIIDPHIKREGGYFVHEDATNQGLYVKNKDGKDYEGWCWPGSSSYLDFFDPKVRKYYSERYLLDNFQGTTNDVHIWNDMNEPSVFNGPEITMPKDCIHYGDWEHRHVHNLYGLLQIKGTYEGLMERSKNTRRPFILTRSAFAGTQRYAAVWTGDNAAEWSHLAVTIPMCLSFAISGVSFCGADVGGFFKYPEAELMTRWYQAGAFQPFFRAHSHIDTKRREPYLYDAQTMAHIRDAIRRRYSYLPLWYTLFYEHSISGLPVMRPIFMHFPKETDLFSIDNEYLIGNYLLVRPVTEEGVSSVTVHLPGSSTGEIWYDVDTYQPLQPGKLNQPVTISKIPVYQRGGTIISKKERMRRSSALMANDPYTLIVALSANHTAEGNLYIDDGESFSYKEGKYIYAKLNYQNNVLSYSLIDKHASYPTKAWLERVVIAGMKTPPKKAELRMLATGTSSPLHLTYHTGNDVLVVRKPEVSMAAPWNIVFE